MNFFNILFFENKKCCYFHTFKTFKNYKISLAVIHNYCLITKLLCTNYYSEN